MAGDRSSKAKRLAAVAEGGVERRDLLRRVGPRAWLLISLAIFCTFAPLWAILTADMVVGARYAGFLAWCVFGGLLALMWFYSFTRSRRWMPAAIVGSVAIGVGGWITESTAYETGSWFSPSIGQPLPTIEGALTFAFLLAAYIFFSRFVNTVGVEHVRLQTEMTLAGRIHDTLVRPVDERLPGAHIVGRSDASAEMGGDLIDLLRRDGVTDLLIADVSGHGVRAGVLMAMLKSALRMRTLNDHAPPLADLASDLNRLVCEVSEDDMFITAAFVRMRDDSREVECVLAGHHPIIHLRAHERGGSEIESQSMPLGVTPDETFTPVVIRCARGDTLVLYTDGLTEAPDAEGRLYSLQRLRDTLRAHAAESPERLVERALADVRAYETGRADDQTIVAIRFL